MIGLKYFKGDSKITFGRFNVESTRFSIVSYLINNGSNIPKLCLSQKLIKHDYD